MDTITHEVRLSNWKSIIEQCSARPEGQTVKEWLEINGIKEKQYYYWQRKIRQAAASEAGIQLPAPRETAEVSFAEIRLDREQPAEWKPPFMPAAVIHTARATIEISACASPALAARILKVVSHAL